MPILHSRPIRRIRNTIDRTTATSLVHPKLDYCHSLLLNIPSAQTNRLQLVLNSAARPNTKTPKFHHIPPILKSLHWLKIIERIQYKVADMSAASVIRLIMQPVAIHPNPSYGTQLCNIYPILAMKQANVTLRPAAT